jgi:predicted alpha/beta-fold hydrolase
METFKPPRLLRNAHVQSILSSTIPRKWFLKHSAKRLIQSSQSHILECGDGVRLQGEYSCRSGNDKGLVILIHGWEGSINSSYILSSANALFNAGFNIYRLNLRDHGDTHHLNEELFNSVRLEEVVNAVVAISKQFEHSKCFLAGFSLGGNFALRVATQLENREIELNKVVAICPLLNPVKTMASLEQGFFVYHDYFHKKWSRSLKKKLLHFPQLAYGDQLRQLKTLHTMNEFFVPRFTSFDSPQSYLSAYAITGDVLKNISVPSHIVSAEDDPVVLSQDLDELARNSMLSIELTRYGGHCGFLQNYRLHSWIDQRLISLFGPEQS